jgi:cell division protein FtsW (lipid II flippase)
MFSIIYKDTEFSKEHLNWAYFIRVMMYCLIAGAIIWIGIGMASQTSGAQRYVLFALVGVYYLFIRATVAIVDGKNRSKWWVFLGLLFFPAMFLLEYNQYRSYSVEDLVRMSMEKNRLNKENENGNAN